jgi:hypothetical protein
VRGRNGKDGRRYLQPIDVGQDVGVPESLEALESSFGHQGLLFRTRLHIVHEDGHRAACGLGEDTAAWAVGYWLSTLPSLGLTSSQTGSPERKERASGQVSSQVSPPGT